MMSRFSFFPAIVAVLLAISCKEKEPIIVSRTVDLTVTVYGDKSSPVPGADVTIDYEHRRTAPDGTCIFEDLLVGRHSITVKAYDYKDYTESLAVEEGMTGFSVNLSALPPYLEADSLLIRTKSLRGTNEMQIRSNSDWTVVSDSPEMSFNITSGHGSGTVRCSWSFQQDSTGLDYKEAFFSIRSAHDTLDFCVRVAMPIFISHVEGVTNNYVENPDGSDMGIIRFSRKVKDVEVHYPVEAEITKIDDYTVSFPVPGSNLCRDFLKISVKAHSANGDGVVCEADDLSIPYYDQRAIFDGTCMGFFLSRDQKTIWMSTGGPDKLRQIDTKSFEVLKEIDVDFHPGPLSLNPYNGLLYVIDEYRLTDDPPVLVKSIHVVNPDNGKEVKTISLEPEEDPRFGLLPVSPYKLLFANNGMGAVWVVDEHGYNRSIRLIDSRNEDKVIKHKYLEQEFDTEFEDAVFNIRDIMLDNTWTKFIALVDNSYKFFILDSDGVNGHHFKMPNRTTEDGFGGSLLIYKQHPEKPLLYLVMPYSQALYDMTTNSYSDPFTGIPAWNAIGDFCYGAPFGEDICTYLLFKDQFLLVMDHTTKEIIYYGSVAISYLEELIAFHEGDRILFYENMLDKTFFTVINTSRFWK